MATRDILAIQAVNLFRQAFKSEPEIAVAAPGRANLIGEHTDYNEGFVLPFALPYKTVIVASKLPVGSKTKIISGEFSHDTVEFVIDSNLSKGTPTWANYVKGTIYQYLPDLPVGVAFQAAIVSNVPLGGGLSSSASLEVSVATALETLYELQIDGITKALRCQKAEHTFADMPCGIMDQFISTLGKDGNLLLIDCRTNGSTLVPFGKGEDTPIILVTNSNVKHALTGSEYPDRVRQCKEAVAALKKKYPNVNSLRDATLEMLESVKTDLSEAGFKRGRHVIGENARTLSTVEALKAKEYGKAGDYMTQSHNSLRDDYEVSCEEIDFLVRSALTIPGVYGSRITGGGFGGCTVTLVDRKAVKDLEKFLQESYYKQYHKRCDCYEATPSPGATVLDLSHFLNYRRDSNAGELSVKIEGSPSGGNEIPLPDFSAHHYIVPVVAVLAAVGVAFYYYGVMKR